MFFLAQGLVNPPCVAFLQGRLQTILCCVHMYGGLIPVQLKVYTAHQAGLSVASVLPGS